MMPFPAMVPEAAASTHKQHLLGDAAPTSTTRRRENTHQQLNKASKTTPQGRSRHNRRHRPPGNPELGISPGEPRPKTRALMELHAQSLQEGRRRRCAAAAGTDKISAKLSLESPPHHPRAVQAHASTRPQTTHHRRRCSPTTTCRDTTRPPTTLQKCPGPLPWLPCTASTTPRRRRSPPAR
jgi:hypothetical protein